VTEVILGFMLAMLLTTFVIAAYGVHLGLKAQVTAKQANASIVQPTQFAPIEQDPAMEEEARRLNNMLNGYEDEELESLGTVQENTFRQGPII
jgi:hypothetical protein